MIGLLGLSTGIRGLRSGWATGHAAHVSRSDQRAISSVAGNGSAVTHASLGVALDAVTYGGGLALLTVDHVEPAKQTVRDGRYRMRRPVLLLRKHASNPTAVSFADFAHSTEAKVIIEEMFVSYTGPETEPMPCIHR